MEAELFEVPVLFIMWNRPKCLEYSFRIIREVRPRFLYVACDGFRDKDELNNKLVVRCRNMVEQLVDWPCELSLRYLENNVGCKEAVSGAITWFFDNVESGIIIEDDVICQKDFFQFAKELLNRYSEDARIGAISANSFYSDSYLSNYSYQYYFTAFPHIWGWATWRRVWNQYSAGNINIRSTRLWKDMYARFGIVGSLFWLKYWIDTNKGAVDTWDYQLAYLFFNKGLACCCPVKELSKNIGYNHNGTNTAEGTSHQKDIGYLTWPLKHPCTPRIDATADRKVLKENYQPSLRRIIKKKFLFLHRE